MKKIIVSVLALLGIAAGHVLYLYNHREFGPKDFHHPSVLYFEPTISPSAEVKKEAEAALNQKYTYLGYGGQMTAYESADGKYVLKFFNPRSAIKENWFHQFGKIRRFNSLKWLTKTYLKKKERLQKYFLRYELAFKDLKEETGLIYVHLDSSTRLDQTVEIVDKQGNLHQMAVNDAPFVLQKKVELTMTHLNRLMKAGKVEEAKESVRQIYALFLSRAQKGYTDRLQTLDKNYGFYEGKAVQLDVGRIRKEEFDTDQEVERVIGNVAPSLDPEFAKILQDCLKMTPEAR